MVATPCLDDNDAAEFASGALRGTAATRVERHLAGCRDCRALVAALAPAAGEADSDIATAPRPARAPRGKRRRDAALEATVPRGLAEPEVAVGDTIGRYVVLTRQGAGGMGVVWSAYDPQLDRKVALKLLRAGSGVESSEGRARLVREAQAIAQLAHPNVVAVYDVGTAESGEVYIAMEFVEGETLTAWLARWERPWRDARDVFVQAGRGLAAAHAVGLLHRDFKPDNVLVGTEGRVRVTDFGLARSLITAGGDDETAGPAPALASLRMTLTATGTVLGTPRYMAPEQIRGAGTDARSDQFSFCVAMYEALYGRHPLPGDTAVDMVEHGARALPAPDGPVPTFIGRALARGLDPEPSRRFPSMQTLLHELTPRPVRTRERWLAAGLGGLLLVGAAGATLVATGSSSTTSVQPEVVQQLLDQIQELRRERDHLLDDLKKAQNDSHEIAHLRQQIIERDTRIQVLVTEVANLSAQPLPPVPVRPRPAPAAGLSQAQVKAGLDQVRLDGCMQEWRDRVPDTDLELTATVVVTPDGHSHSAAVRGTDDSVLPDCIVARLDRATFAAVGAETTVEMAIRLGGHKVTMLPRVASVRAAPEVIDPADLRPLAP